MAPEPGPAREMARADFTIQGESFRLAFRVTVPAGLAQQRDLLPVARALSDAVVGETGKALEAAGEPIACTRGCAACCRNLIALSEVEARRLRELVLQLPEPRRAALQARFAEARERADSAGLLQKLQAADQWTEADYAALVRTYFDEQIACPFLEAEACSIYAERPIACREYLVTSPAAHCARPGSEGVRRVRLPLPIFNAVARWQVPPQGHFLESWVPLILALEWAEAHPDDPPPKPGLQLLQELLVTLNDR